MTVTQINELSFSTGHNLTERLVADGAPALPLGYEYKVHITHQSLTYDVAPAKPLPTVTVQIGYPYGDDQWIEAARYTEVTRSHLHGAIIAAAVHAFDGWDQ